MKWFKGVFCFLLITLVLAGMVGCHTVHGLGKDIEKGGEGIQKW